MATGQRNGSAGDPGEHVSPRDRWWFSPMLQFVAGGAIAAFQWGPVAAGTANWLNWVVAAAGLAVMALGARAWLAARPRG